MQPMHVLHVEDDFADAMLLQHALCDAGAYNFDLEVVRTLRDARAKLAKRRFDLIIADLRLPDSIDPHATIANLKTHAAGSPILVLTGAVGVDADTLGRTITVLDKNALFHKRDDRKSRALLAKVREVTESAASGGGDDEDDALML